MTPVLKPDETDAPSLSRAPSPARRWGWVALGVVVALCAAIYAPALGGYFHIDDWYNLHFALGWKGSLRVFAGEWSRGLQGQGGFYRPLGRCLFETDRWLFGTNAGGYHLTNLALHAINGWLCFWLLRRVLADARWALAGAALFTAFPTHVEAVYWLSARTGLVATLFALLALGWHYEAATERKRWALGAAVGAMALALMGKESAVALPFMMTATEAVLLLSAKPASAAKRALARLAPFYALLLAYLAFRRAVLGEPGDYWSGITLAAVAHSARTIVGTLVNPFWDAPFFWQAVGPLAGIGALVAVWLVARCPRAGALGLLWMLAACLPLLSLGMTWRQEGRIGYDPALGYVLFLMASARGVCEGWRLEAGGWRARLVVGLVAALLVAYGLRARANVGDWREASDVVRSSLRFIGDSLTAAEKQGRAVERVAILDPPDNFDGAYVHHGHSIMMALSVTTGRPEATFYVGFRPDDTTATLAFRFVEAGRRVVEARVERTEQQEWRGAELLQAITTSPDVQARLLDGGETTTGGAVVELDIGGPESAVCLPALAATSPAAPPEDAVYTLWLGEFRVHPPHARGALGWVATPGQFPQRFEVVPEGAPAGRPHDDVAALLTLPPPGASAAWLAWHPTLDVPRRALVRRLAVTRFHLGPAPPQ